MGKAYYQQGQLSRWWPQANNTFDKATIALGLAIELNPRMVKAFELRGKAYIAQTAYDKAIPDYVTVVNFDPVNPTSHHNLAGLYMQTRDVDLALRHAEEAVKLDPRSTSFRDRLVGIHQWEKTDVPTAASILEQALEFKVSPLKEFEIRSRVSTMRGDHQKTVEYIGRCFELGGESSGLHVRRAVAYRNLGEGAKALDELQKAEEIAASDWEHVEIAHEYRSHERLDQAIAVLEKAERLNPNNAVVYRSLGHILSDQGRHQEALESYGKCITLAPRSYRVYYFRADIYAGLGSHEKALQEYRKCIEINPQYSGAYYARGNVYAHLGSHEKAAQEYSKCVEVDANFTPALVNRGHSLQELHRWEEALASWRMAIQRDADNAKKCRVKAENGVAWLLATCPDTQQRDPVLATEHAKKAVELAPNTDSWNTLGVAYYRAGDYQSAIEALERSEELGKNAGAFNYYFLAMAHRQLDAKEEAWKWYEKAVTWMEKNAADNEDLLLFHAEAKELLEIPGQSKPINEDEEQPAQLR